MTTSNKRGLELESTIFDWRGVKNICNSSEEMLFLHYIIVHVVVLVYFLLKTSALSVVSLLHRVVFHTFCYLLRRSSSRLSVTSSQTTVCPPLSFLLLKPGFHMMVPMVPIVSNNVQTIGTIIWKHYPDDWDDLDRFKIPRVNLFENLTWLAMGKVNLEKYK